MATWPDIQSLTICLQQLECDKATERKKNAEKLEKFLNLDNVINYLKSNPPQSLSFTAIFKCVQGYLIKESEIIRKKSDLNSSASREESKIVQCSKLLRHVVEVANKNDPSIKCQEFVDCATKILHEKFYSFHYANTYLDLLVVYFLKYDKCIQTISSEQYKGLLLVCSKSFNDSGRHVSAQLLYAINAIIKCIIRQCSTAEHQYLFEFFKSSIHRTRSELSGPLLDEYLSSLYQFSCWQLSSAYDLVAELGVTTLPPVAFLLQSKKLSISGYILTVKYCMLQVNVLCGLDKETKMSTYQSDYNKSAEIFKDMFETLLSKLKTISNFRNRKDSNEVKEIILLLSTLVHVFIAFGKEDGLSCLQKQVGNSLLTQQSQIHNSSCFVSLFVRLFCCDNSSQVQYVFLQVMNKFVNAYPEDIVNTDLAFVLATLCDLITNSKNEGVLSVAFQFLVSLLSIEALKKAACNGEFSCIQQLWEISKRQACLMKASQYQPSQLAFEVLAILSDYNCSQLKNNNCNLAATLPVLCLSVFPSKSILKFLLVSLKKNGFIEKSSKSSFNDATKDHYSLRFTLLDWICGCADVILNSDLSHPQSESNRSEMQWKLPSLLAPLFSDGVYPPDPNLTAEVIEGLCSINIEVNSDVAGSKPSAKEKKFEKIFISVLCDHVFHLACSMLNSISEFLMETTIELKQIYTATYVMHLVLVIMMKLNKDFHVESSLIRKVTESMSSVLQSLPYHCATEVFKVLENLQGFVKTSQTGSNRIQPGSEEIVHLNKLSIATLNWSLDYFNDCNVSPNDMEFGQNSLEHSFSSTRKRSLDDSFSQQPDKLRRISLDRSSVVSRSGSFISNDFKQPDHSGVYEVAERCLLLSKDIAMIAGGKTTLMIFKEVFTKSVFDRSNPIHVEIFLRYVKIFSVHLERFDWFKFNDVMSPAKHILRDHYRNQVVYVKWLITLPVLLKILVMFSGDNEAYECVKAMFSHLSTIEKMLKQCNDEVKLSMMKCLVDISTVCDLSTVTLPFSKYEAVLKKAVKFQALVYEVKHIKCLLFARRKDRKVCNASVRSHDRNKQAYLKSIWVCEKYLHFLQSDNIAILTACASGAKELFKLTKTYGPTAVEFYQDVVDLLKTVREKVVRLISSCKEKCKTFCYISSYLETLWSLMPYCFPHIEAIVVFEACEFASLAYIRIGADPVFISVMKKSLHTFESQLSVPANEEYLSQYLQFVLYKWPSFEKFDSFPFYFFRSSSVGNFLAKNATQSLPIMLMNLLCNKKDPSIVFNLFKHVDGAIPTFVASFLACLHSQDTASSKSFLLNCFNGVLQKLHFLSKNTSSMNDVLWKSLPKIFAACLYYFHDNSRFNTLPFALSREGIEACFSILLEWHVNGKFNFTVKRFKVSLFLSYFKSSPSVLLEFFLSMRGLLNGTKICHEEIRLVHAYKYAWTLLSKFEEKQMKELVVSTMILTLTSRLNVTMQQILNKPTNLLSNLSVVYLELIQCVYKDALKNSSQLLQDETLALHLSSCLVFASFATSQKSELSNFDRQLRTFFAWIVQDNNSTSLIQLILLSSVSGNASTIVQQVHLSYDVRLVETLVGVITKSINTTLFSPACSIMLQGLLKQLSKTLQNINSFSISQESLLDDAYSAILSLPIATLDIEDAFTDCLRNLGQVSLKLGSSFQCVKHSETEPLKLTLLSLCDTYMLEDVGKASVALQCLINISKCEEFSQILQSGFSPFYNNFVNSFRSSTTHKSISFAQCESAWKLPGSGFSADCDYEQWICDLASSLIGLSEIYFIQLMQNVCSLSPAICRHILPYIFLHLVMTHHRNSIIQKINAFFSSDPDKKKWTCMLDTIEYVRSYFTKKRSSNAEKTSPGLQRKKVADSLNGLDFLQLAEAAMTCSEPTTALLYLELWAGSDEVSAEKTLVMEWKTPCLLDRVVHSTGPNGGRALEVATRAYSMLKELEALRECHSISSSSNLKHASICQMENNWLAALHAHDLHESSHGEVLRCLQECGFQQVGDIYARNLEDSPDQQIEELRYKSAWQCGRWDEMMGNLAKPTSSFHKLVYVNLLSMHLSHSNNFEHALSKLRSTCVNFLNYERKRFVNFHELKTVLMRLECLREAETAFRLMQNGDIERICNDWTKSNVSLDSSTHHDDRLSSSLRTSLLNIISKRHKDERLLEIQASHYLDCIGAANKSGRLQHSKQIVQELNSVVACMQGEKQLLWRYKAKLQMALLLWQQKEESFSLSLLRGLLEELRSGAGKLSCEETLLLSSVLHTAGTWFDSLKYEGASVIMNDYFKQSANLLEETSSTDCNDSGYFKQLVESHLSLAKFADKQLQEVEAYKSSQEYSDKCDYAVSSPVNGSKIAKSVSKKTSIILEKNSNIDKQELNAVNRNELDFLLTALKSYVRCLQLSDRHDALLHRICALWFDHQTNEQVNSFISESHTDLPSYKYVSLCYQLSARLSKSEHRSYFSRLVKEIVTRLAIDHPHHALPVVLALVNAHKDSEDKTPQVNSNFAAIIEDVKKKKPSLVRGNEKLMNVYIELANCDASPWRNQLMKLIEFPRSIAINQLCNPKSRMCKELRGVVIPVCELPLRKSANYQTLPDSVLFSHFQAGFKTCGGINIPKVVVSLAVNGREKRHLVKGKDDLRQDAVMQQVFELVNILLAQRSKCVGTSVRVYKVVPLTQQSGLVEWCENTIPIGAYLAGNPVQNLLGAHARLRPNDPPILACRKKLASVARQSVDVKLKTYNEVCSKLPPVFRYFCIEKFLNPQEWFLARRRYTQSVAVSSMVGYMLGLGDRHVQNILIDTNNGEVIHIDLGVAFEQGRCLPTPETVPFRLTRDIVDGMGLTGVEDLFRKCCEETMTLLRTSFDVIIPVMEVLLCCEETMTLLRTSFDVIIPVMEVLLYDPLHDWSMPPVKATNVQKLQAGGGESLFEAEKKDHQTNKLAARALLRVKEKLRGNENGSVLSVPGQVNMLIQQAMDRRRLCQLFVGWQPYL